MKKKVFVQSLKWFLPLLFITFINSKMFFIHSHFEDDLIVVHSHPFNKNEKTTHNHTPKEFIAIEFHTQGLSTDSIVPDTEIDSPLQYLVQKNHSRKHRIVYTQKVTSNPLRAPPSPFKV